MLLQADCLQTRSGRNVWRQSDEALHEFVEEGLGKYARRSCLRVIFDGVPHRVRFTLCPKGVSVVLYVQGCHKLIVRLTLNALTLESTVNMVVPCAATSTLVQYFPRMRGSGTHCMRLIEAMEKTFRVRSSRLIDGSCLRGCPELSMKKLFLLSSGRTWYYQHGYRPSSHEAEVLEAELADELARPVDEFALGEKEFVLSVFSEGARCPMVQLPHISVLTFVRMLRARYFSGRLAGTQVSRLVNVLWSMLHVRDRGAWSEQQKIY